MATATIPTIELRILHRLMKRNQWSPTAARAILKMDFDEEDRLRMKELSKKAQEAMLTSEEQAEIDSYERVGHLLDLLHSKARRSLKHGNGRA